MALPKIVTRLVGRMVDLLPIQSSAGAADAEKIPATNADGVLDASLLNATDTSAGAGDAGKIPQLDAAGRLDSSMMPVGLGADTSTIQASENLAAGDIVNVWNDGGTPKVRKADATAEGKEVVGFVLAGVTSGQNATVYHEGRITGLSGLVPGTRYYVAKVAGQVTADVSTYTTGNVVQFVGVALSATELTFEYGEPITIGA